MCSWPHLGGEAPVAQEVVHEQARVPKPLVLDGKVVEGPHQVGNVGTTLPDQNMHTRRGASLQHSKQTDSETHKHRQAHNGKVHAPRHARNGDANAGVGRAPPTDTLGGVGKGVHPPHPPSDHGTHPISCHPRRTSAWRTSEHWSRAPMHTNVWAAPRRTP